MFVIYFISSFFFSILTSCSSALTEKCSCDVTPEEEHTAYEPVTKKKKSFRYMMIVVLNHISNVSNFSQASALGQTEIVIQFWRYDKLKWPSDFSLSSTVMLWFSVKCSVDSYEVLFHFLGDSWLLSLSGHNFSVLFKYLLYFKRTASYLLKSVVC